jgi:hypothetical protein
VILIPLVILALFGVIYWLEELASWLDRQERKGSDGKTKPWLP